MKDINVGFVSDSGGNLDILLPQNYKNQTILSVGAAYQTGNWTLRGGGRMATQALRSETLIAVIPAIPRKQISAGFSYAFSKEDSIDFAYAHAFKESMGNASLPNTSAPIQVTRAAIRSQPGSMSCTPKQGNALSAKWGRTAPCRAKTGGRHRSMHSAGKCASSCSKARGEQADVVKMEKSITGS